MWVQTQMNILPIYCFLIIMAVTRAAVCLLTGSAIALLFPSPPHQTKMNPGNLPARANSISGRWIIRSEELLQPMNKVWHTLRCWFNVGNIKLYSHEVSSVSYTKKSTMMYQERIGLTQCVVTSMSFVVTLLTFQDDMQKFQQLFIIL